MIRHIVLLRWNEATTAAAVDDILRKTRLLNGIDGVLKVEIHKNLGLAKPVLGRGIQHLLIVTLRDTAALAVYGPHPLHAELGRSLLPATAEIMVVDYEFAD